MYESDSKPLRADDASSRLQSFAELLQSKGTLVGAAVTIGNLLCAQITARAGFDWALIDMEHAPLTPRETSNIVQAVVTASGGQCLPFVRVPSHGVEWIKWALDSGAAGVIIPMVTNAQECRDILQRALYPPRGQRSFGPFLAPFADTDPSSDVARYLSKRVDEIAIIPMIESVEGVQNAHDILSVPGVTGCFIGPYDLRQSMGLNGGDGEEPQYVEALQKVVHAGQKCGVVVGTVGTTEAATKRKAELGFRFLLSGQEPAFLASGAAAALHACQRGLSKVKTSNL